MASGSKGNWTSRSMYFDSFHFSSINRVSSLSIEAQASRKWVMLVYLYQPNLIFIMQFVVWNIRSPSWTYCKPSYVFIAFYASLIMKRLFCVASDHSRWRYLKRISRYGDTKLLWQIWRSQLGNEHEAENTCTVVPNSELYIITQHRRWYTVQKKTVVIRK